MNFKRVTGKCLWKHGLVEMSEASMSVRYRAQRMLKDLQYVCQFAETHFRETETRQLWSKGMFSALRPFPLPPCEHKNSFHILKSIPFVLLQSNLGCNKIISCNFEHKIKIVPIAPQRINVSKIYGSFFFSKNSRHWIPQAENPWTHGIVANRLKALADYPNPSHWPELPMHD